MAPPDNITLKNEIDFLKPLILAKQNGISFPNLSGNIKHLTQNAGSQSALNFIKSAFALNGISFDEPQF